MSRRNLHNFSGGPGVLPESVLSQLQQAIICEPQTGLSVLGISHRSDWFAAVVAEIGDNIRQLLGLAPDWQVLLLQGGATQQFTMVPMALLGTSGVPADYLHTGYWSGKAIPEARRVGPINVAWSGADGGFARLPAAGEVAYNAQAPYLHYVSNETVEGLQFHDLPGLPGVPRVCDMSSDFLSRPFSGDDYALIYAHAQKNIGPAGVTVVLLRDALIERLPEGLPGFLDYRVQAAAHSNYNTPPVFAIYTVLLVTRWLRDEIGGLAAMDALNRRKAAALYAALDAADGFYRGRAAAADRSLMNVSFTLPTSELETRFLAAAAAAGFSGLAGHRSVGGIRASIYNAMTLPAVEALAAFLDDFRRRA